MKHLLACLLLLPLSALSQEKVNPAIKNFGSVYAIPDATEKPDPKMTYKILVDITDAASKPDTINVYLEAVATLFNLHVIGGVPPSHIKMVVVLHKMATFSILGDEKYQQRFHCNNPNLPLLKSLAGAGVRFFVCGQTLTRARIAASEISPDVAVATSALTTLTTYQLKGYAMVNFK